MNFAGRPHEVELRLISRTTGAGPVSCGIPWPRGALRDCIHLALRDIYDRRIPLQARSLDRWPDSSLRWILLDWHAETEAAPYRLGVTDDAPLQPQNAMTVRSNGSAVTVDTGTAQFEIHANSQFPFRSVRVSGVPAIDAARTSFAVEDENGRQFVPHVTAIRIQEPGPLRAQVHVHGKLRSSYSEELADFESRLHFYANSAMVRFELTIRNPRKAAHPGGLWDLGNDGSIYLRDASLTIAMPDVAASAIRCSQHFGAPFEILPCPLELYQDSSGGPNWKSSNHLNRRHDVPNTFRGYRLKAGAVERLGERATPALSLTAGDCTLGVTVPSFWQNFPKAIEATSDSVVLRLFPRQYADVHELQGGEQKTHDFAVLLGSSGSDAAEQALAWFRAPAVVAATPEWYCASAALPYLTPKADDPNVGYLKLVDAAIEGPNTFEHKREVIDEYGWRHFGDIYGDHEAVFQKGPTPLVSHYNNQYDAIAGFAHQFLRSGDKRWFQHMNELAAHVIDIDIYHTDRDKSAYNHGQFWHTFHYVDADTGTHRSYPKAAKVCGGGPANEQCYTTGLMLHHFLTGSPASRESALGLARWVIDMDDGDRTVFRWLARGDTGLASKSRTFDYHGPGRGAANSIAALIDGHRLSGDAAFLAKAEQLIRRCIHPADNVPARNLLDAENRWFYTMFLQSLGRYLDHKAERGELDRMYAYARASLLHYARWMADNEYPYLDKPEILEYPTETWPAQDIRKSDIFKIAAKHATNEERDRFLNRSEFFFRYAVEKLSTMPTRSLARPVVLLLSNGYMHAYFQKKPNESAPVPPPISDFGEPESFVPQKTRAIRRCKILAASGAIAGGLLLVYLLSLLFR
jgi:YetA-like protein